MPSDPRWKLAKLPRDLWKRAKTLAVASDRHLQSLIADGVRAEVDRLEHEQKSRMTKDASEKTRLGR
jgi:hypothetical protein